LLRHVEDRIADMECEQQALSDPKEGNARLLERRIMRD
jgi:hypothetical protein